MNTLHTIFDWLLAASLRASVLTLLVFVIQWVLQRHLSPRWRYALWLPVLIVLLAPVLPESRWSIESVFQTESPPVEIHPIPVVADVIPMSVPSIIPSAVSMPTPVDWTQIQFMTWALGALLLLLVGGFSFLRTLLRFQRSRQSVSDDLLSQLEAISHEVGLRSSPRVLVAPAIQSPAVTGLLRPTLLLPSGFERDFTANEARLILQHELTHLKRHDLPLNTLLCVLMALHWFNPLLWLAFFKARADREAACDAQVLADASPQRRSEYGHALLKVEAAFAPLRLSLGFIGMLQRGATLRARIHSIALPSRTRPLAGLLATLCIAGMTFLGITRAEKPGAATEDETTLIAIEIETVRLLQDTPWDFGGRLKQIDPTDELKAGGQIEMLSEKDFHTLQEHLRKLAGADIAAYPRMVTKDEKEVMIRSVVNQPVLGGKDSKGKDLIAYLPIGFVGKFTPKAMQDGKVAVNIDITDSRIIATETIQGSEYPVAASRVYSGPVELQPGITVAQYAWQGHGWKDGKPQSYRPTVTFITTHVIDPKEGGLPADASKDFSIGHSSFLPGDRIRITKVQRSAGFMTVTADYELASAETANISLYITSTKDNGGTKTDPNQRKTITKGKGRVVLHHPDVREGMPHVSFYPTRGGSSFGGIYFGTQAEADASQKMNSSHATAAAAKTSGASSSSFTIGNSAFLPSDSIQIISVERSKDLLSVTADYTLTSQEKANLSLYVTGNQKGPPFDQRQAAAVTKGKGRITLHHPSPPPGQPHLSYYDLATHKAFGGIYFGTPEEAAASKKFDLGDMLASKPAGSATSAIETKLQNIIFPSLNFPNAPVSDIIDYLRTKSRDLDTATSDPTQRGVNILHRGDPPGGKVTISLFLKDVTLGTALQHVAELAGLKVSIEPYAVLIAPDTSPSAKNSASIQSAASLAAEPHAGKIILPIVQFREASLKDAIAFIRHSSLQNDPDKQGVNISLKGDGGDTKITLSLKSVPVFEALRYCAELSNHKLNADEAAFILTPVLLEKEAASNQLKSSDNELPGTDAQAKADELRRAKPRDYDFAKADLGDVIRFLATDAGIRFFSLPEDHPTSQRLITFSLRGSPFEVFETICKANDVILVLEQNVWYARPSDDSALVGKSYALPKTAASPATVLADLRTILKIPDKKAVETEEGPAVTFKEAENSIHVTATRLQHTWIGAYFKGLGQKR